MEDKTPKQITSATDVIGEWSSLQKRLLTFFILVYVTSPFENLGIVFFAPKLKYWCVRPPGFENVTLENECFNPVNTSEPCTEWKYDKSVFTSTIVSEFNLVCDRSWFPSVAASSYQIGYVFSAVFFGYLSDKYGRRFTMKFAIYLEIISGTSQALSISIYHFLVSRFCLGIAAYGRFFTGFLLIFECFGKKNRAPVSSFIEVGWVFGRALMPLMFYVLPHFRYVQLIVTAYLILSLFWFRVVPESLRWQLTHDQFAEAEQAMSEAAEKDGQLSIEELDRRLQLLKEHIEQEEEKLAAARKQTLFDLWKAPNMLKYCLVLYFTYFVQGFVNYGVSFNIGDFGGDLFITFFMVAIAELFSDLAFIYAFKKFKRVPLMASCLTVSAVGSLGLAAVLWFNYATVLRVIIAMIINFFTIGCFHLIYVQAVEIIPTTMRQLGVGSSTIAARVGSIIAPFIREFSEWTHPAASMTIFAVLMIVNACLIFVLPETKNVEIPDTIDEASSMGNNRNRREKNDC